MTGKQPDPIALPARVSVLALAEALDRPLDEVQAVLDSRGEPSGPREVVGSDLSVALARALGRHVTIETRDLVLETLYEFEIRGEWERASLPPRALAIINGVVDNRESLDHEIEAASEHWSVARMPLVDRTILRMGLYELRYDPDTPTAVVISEAVRLAKCYSTERSSSFVNGVLASLARGAR